MIVDTLYNFIRWFEKVLFGGAAVLVLVLIVLLTIGYGSDEPRGMSEATSPSKPVLPAARNSSDPSKGASLNSSSKPADEYDPGGPRSGQLLCAPQGDLFYLKGQGVAAAADSDGHFTFYGLPDPKTGRPSRDSYDLLRDCVPDMTFANLAHVEVVGPVGRDTDVLGSEPARTTLKDADGRLTTVYEPSQGLRVTQRISLIESSAGREETLNITYELENYTDEDRRDIREIANQPIRVSLSSILAPPLAAGPSDTAVFNVPSRAAGRELRKATSFSGSSDRPDVINAPRVGAASDASGQWRRPADSVPNRVVAAGWLDLAAAPLGFDIDTSATLASDAALSVQWIDQDLDPGQTLTFSHRYTAAGAS